MFIQGQEIVGAYPQCLSKGRILLVPILNVYQRAGYCWCLSSMFIQGQDIVGAYPQCLYKDRRLLVPIRNVYPRAGNCWYLSPMFIQGQEIVGAYPQCLSNLFSFWLCYFWQEQSYVKLEYGHNMCVSRVLSLGTYQWNYCYGHVIVLPPWYAHVVLADLLFKWDTVTRNGWDGDGIVTPSMAAKSHPFATGSAHRSWRSWVNG